VLNSLVFNYRRTTDGRISLLHEFESGQEVDACCIASCTGGLTRTGTNSSSYSLDICVSYRIRVGRTSKRQYDLTRI